MISKIALLGFISAVAAHGTVSNITADGIFYDGYNPSYQWINPAPITVGWKIPNDLDNGFIAPSAYTDPNIICHVGATNAQIEAPVKAGGKVTLRWTPWPVTHKGPVLDYLANCNGPCETVDKTTLKWFKISHVGLYDKSRTNGYWASDNIVDNAGAWSVVIPPTLKTGNYVLRHEIIALHAAGGTNGAQNYPQCVNLAIKGTGTAVPTGVAATSFYNAADPGIKFDLYGSFTTYTIPGPTVWSGGVRATQSVPSAPTATATGVYTVT